jgi:hypothetical protein
MLTLEGFPAYMDEATDIHRWAWIYFVSFIRVAAFIVLNVLIGIVLNSMEEARELERREGFAHAWERVAARPRSIRRGTPTSSSGSSSSEARSTTSSWSWRSTARRRTNAGRSPLTAQGGTDAALRDTPQCLTLECHNFVSIASGVRFFAQPSGRRGRRRGRSGLSDAMGMSLADVTSCLTLGCAESVPMFPQGARAPVV